MKCGCENCHIDHARSRCCKARIEDGVCSDCGLPTKKQFLEALRQLEVKS